MAQHQLLTVASKNDILLRTDPVHSKRVDWHSCHHLSPGFLISTRNQRLRATVLRNLLRGPNGRPEGESSFPAW